VCTCIPDCTGKKCGSDGCDGQCGQCIGPQEQCIDGVCTCIPDCAGKKCGSDGCVGDCGKCVPPAPCVTSTCKAGTCEESVQQFFCLIEKVCVPSGTNDPANPCAECDPLTSQDMFSPVLDGIPCGAGHVCFDGVCCDHASHCQGKECGDDGCGGVCGACLDNGSCDQGTCVPQDAECNDHNKIDWDGCTNWKKSESLVNLTTGGAQSAPDIAVLGSGGYVVVWQSAQQDGSADGVFGRIYGADGSALAGEIQLNAFTQGAQSAPAVAALPGGGFVAVWQSLQQDGDNWGVFGRVFSNSGTAAQPETVLNTATAGDQSAPDVAALPGGDFLAAWGGHNDQDQYGVSARLFSTNGSPKGMSKEATSNKNGDAHHPAVAVLADGGFVIAWDVTGQGNFGLEVKARRFDGSGLPLAGELSVNTTTSGDQLAPSAAALGDGGFVVAWQGQDSSGTGVVAQVFTSQGIKKGSELILNSTTLLAQGSPSLCSFSSGGFLGVWTSDGQDKSGLGVIARTFDSNTLPSSFELTANLFTQGEQSGPTCATLPDGSFLVAWHSVGQDSSDLGVFLRRFLP